MKKLEKKYAIMVNVNPKFDGVKKLSDWDKKSKLYFRDGGYPFTMFTTDYDKAKLYSSKEHTKKVLNYLKTLWSEYVVCDKADIVAVTIITEKRISEEVETVEF